MGRPLDVMAVRGIWPRILMSLAFLAIALTLNNIAGKYVDRVGNAVSTDIILDNIPVVDLSTVYVYGYALVIAILFLYPVLFERKCFHVVVTQLSLLICIRSFFITLTHLKPPANAIMIHFPSVFPMFVFSNDMFFSGHTALPFLGYLLFKRRRIRVFFLLATITLALTVFFMHDHYSIDVFAAFFITYGSYKLGNLFFEKLDNKQYSTKETNNITGDN